MGGIIQPEQKRDLIEMKGISRDYLCGGNVIRALKSIDLNITQGEFVGIMGPSASGKSTLLNILGCLDSPTNGQYQLKGRDVKELSGTDKASVRNKVFGFVFQSFNILSELNIAANVALPLKYGGVPRYEWKSMVNEALEAVGLEGTGERYPDQLSGGQQQRVAIARALVNRPDVILADEPTGNLDSVTGEGIMEELRKLKDQSGRTVIVITHDSRIAGYADRLIRLEDGRIVEDMPIHRATEAADILKNPFKDFYGEESNEDLL